jgi:hypothetical protein
MVRRCVITCVLRLFFWSPFSRKGYSKAFSMYKKRINICFLFSFSTHRATQSHNSLLYHSGTTSRSSTLSLPCSPSPLRHSFRVSVGNIALILYHFNSNLYLPIEHSKLVLTCRHSLRVSVGYATRGDSILHLHRQILLQPHPWTGTLRYIHRILRCIVFIIGVRDICVLHLHRQILVQPHPWTGTSSQKYFLLHRVPCYLSSIGFRNNANKRCSWTTSHATPGRARVLLSLLNITISL